MKVRGDERSVGIDGVEAGERFRATVTPRTRIEATIAIVAFIASIVTAGVASWFHGSQPQVRESSRMTLSSRYQSEGAGFAPLPRDATTKSRIASPMLTMASAILSGMNSPVHEVIGGPQVDVVPGMGVGQTGMLVTHVIGFHASATARPTAASATPRSRRNQSRDIALSLV